MPNKQILFWLTGLLLITSCSIEKRYHSSGFYIDWHKPVTIKNPAGKKEKSVQISTQTTCINKQVTQLAIPKLARLEKVNSFVVAKPKKYSSKTSVIPNIKPAPKNKMKTFVPKRPKLDEPEPKQLEPFGLISFILLLLPISFAISFEGADILAAFMPVFFLAAVFLAGFSLGRIQSKPYLYYGAIFGLFTLAILLLFSGAFVLILLYPSLLN
jgi:hypothetical protein